MKRKYDGLIGLIVGLMGGVGTAIVLTLLAYVLVGCGTEVRQEQSAQARIEIYYPNCAEIEDDEIMVECIKAASTVKIEVGGTDSILAEEQDLLDSLNITGEGV